MSKQWRSTLDKASAWSGQRRQRQRSFPRSYRTPKSCSFVTGKFRAASEVNAFKVTFQPNCAVINCIKEETPHACHPSAPTADRIGIRNPDLDSASDPELPGRYLSDPARTDWALSPPHRALHELKALDRSFIRRPWLPELCQAQYALPPFDRQSRWSVRHLVRLVRILSSTCPQCRARDARPRRRSNFLSERRRE